MMGKFKITDYKLCYVDRNRAYFTTQELDKQWGDDWNDAPYEHNAGTPYFFSTHDAAQGRAEWDILMLFFYAPMETPEDVANGNSRYSVESINRKDVAWLRPYGGDEGKPIFAGVNPLEFRELIEANKGDVYVRPADYTWFSEGDTEINPITLVYR